MDNVFLAVGPAETRAGCSSWLRALLRGFLLPVFYSHACPGKIGRSEGHSLFEESAVLNLSQGHAPADTNSIDLLERIPATSLDVSVRGFTEHALVFPVELGHAFIAN